MKKLILGLFALSALSLSAADVQKFPLVGEYVGKADAQKGWFKDSPDLSANIHKEGDDYIVVFTRDLCRRAVPYGNFTAKEKNGTLEFENVGMYKFTGTATSEGIKGVVKHWDNKDKKEYEYPFELKRQNRVSPTMGAKPPKGAIVLFDGSNFSQWQPCNRSFITIPWRIDKDGKFMQIAKNKNGHSTDIETKRKFKNARLHIEFRCPDQSQNRGMGQNRGNSGVFFGRFETQVLDSFGAQGMWDECGALYKFSPPQVNATLPPEVWQTYDIEYRGPKAKNGRIVEYPRITVRLNGVIIQNDIELTEGTEYVSNAKSLKHLNDAPVPVRLQFHGDPVSFRNIWIEDLGE